MSDRGACPKVARLFLGDDPEIAQHVTSCSHCRELLEQRAPATDVESSRPTLDADLKILELPVVARDLYTVGAVLGAGGMGITYHAIDHRLGRDVVLKELRDPDDRRQLNLRERFEAEARLTARLQHPNIVRVYEVGQWPDGRPFYAMELFRGRSLAETIAACPDLAARLELLPTLAAVVEAMAHAHERGIVHRDLSASNVLVGEGGEPVIIDWGLAADLRDRAAFAGAPVDGDGRAGLTEIGAGTPNYMCREQARGDEPDARFDVYSLGALLYHLIVGEPPYAACATTGEVKAALERGGPVPISRLESQAPAALITIAETAMAREPAARPATARELGAHLRAYLGGRLVSIHRYSFGGLLAVWRRQYRTALRIGGLALVALAILASFAIRRIVAERDRANATVVAMLVERGRQELVNEEYTRAAVLLAAARDRSGDDGALPYLLARALQPLDARLARISAHAGSVREVVFSDDGTTVATAGLDKTAAVIDRSGRAMLRLADHVGAVTDVAFDPRGRQILTASDDGTAKLWSRSTGELLATLRDHAGPIKNAAFSPDGTTILTVGEDREAILWDATTRAARHHLPGAIHIGLFSRDGQHVLTAGARGEAALWRAADGELLGSLPGHRVTEQSLDFSNRVLAYCRDDRSVQLARLTVTGELVLGPKLTGYSERPLALAFSSDGRYLATGAHDGELRVWRVLYLDLLFWHGFHVEPVLVRPAHDASIRRVVFSTRGHQVATLGSDDIVKLWDPVSAKHLATLEGHAAPVRSAAFSPDGRVLATADVDGELILWDVQRAVERISIPNETPMRALELSQDGSTLVGTGYEEFAMVWDLTDPTTPRTLRHDKRVWTARVSPTGDRIVTTSGDGTAAIWTRDGRRTTLRGHTNHVVDASFDRDGARVVSSAEDGTARIWDARTGRMLGSVSHADDVVAAAFSPSGALLLTASHDGFARIWNSTSLLPVAALGGHAGGVRDAQFDSHERRIATVGHDGGARLWDLEGTLLHRFTGQRLPIWLARITRDGETVVTVDHSVRLWNARTGELRHQLDDAVRVTAMSIAPDGATIATGTGDSHVRLWDVATGAPFAVFELGASAEDHQRAVVGLAFSPDGTRLAASRLDGSLEVVRVRRETRSTDELRALLAGGKWELDETLLIPRARPVRTIDAPPAPSVACDAASCYERGLAQARDALGYAYLDRACQLGDLRGCAQILLPLRILDILPAADSVYVLAFEPRADGIVVIDPQGGESRGGDVFVAHLGKHGYSRRSLRDTTWTVEAGALSRDDAHVLAFTSTRRGSGTWANDGMITRLDPTTLAVRRQESLYTEWNAGYAPIFDRGTLVHFSHAGKYVTRDNDRDSKQRVPWDDYRLEYIQALARKLGLQRAEHELEAQLFRRFLIARYLE